MYLYISGQCNQYAITIDFIIFYYKINVMTTILPSLTSWKINIVILYSYIYTYINYALSTII